MENQRKFNTCLLCVLNNNHKTSSLHETQEQEKGMKTKTMIKKNVGKN